MRRLIRILSYVGLAIATTALVLLFSNHISVPGSNNAVALAKPFNDFPVDQPKFIDLRLDELSFEQLSDREKQDQVRDWLVFAIASDRDLSAKEINESLYDLATTRQGYMRPVSNFEYGTLRSLYVGEGEVVALIPANLKPAERTDALAHITDKHRKDLGRKPTSLLVFEYELNLPEQYATLTRREALDANQLFTPESGYTEAKVTDLNALKAFMDKTQDLTYARLDGNQLTLGGRKLQSRPYGNIRVEDIAAIWQSEDKIKAGQFQVSGSGFSLDPDYDYDALFKVLAAAEPALKKLSLNGQRAIDEALIQEAKSALGSPLGLPGQVNPQLLNLQNPGDPWARENRVVPYLKLIDRVEEVVRQPSLSRNLTSGEVNRLIAFLESQLKLKFQKARYDGDLQGTEVGMVLFYTDLLAKLWSIDYRESTPQKAIPGFLPRTMLGSKIASIYIQEEDELSNTRLWFGPQDKGFQTSADDSLLFARNATRIYAASSNPLEPSKETFASASAEGFLGWWNDHYEEIAVYEPQYERLNEIMKWSLLVSWLNNADHGSALSMLQGVQVKRDFWFPNWAKAQGDRLRFQDWKSIQFYPKGYLGTTTEAMELLESKPFDMFGQSKFISGGVSLGDQAVFQKRVPLSAADDGNTLARRSHVNYQTLQAADHQLTFSTLEETAYRLFNPQPSRASVATLARDGSKLRASQVELANLEFMRELATTDDGLQVTTSFGGTELGQFKTVRTGNGFAVGMRPLALEEGSTLVRQMNQAKGQSLTGFMQDHPLVATAVEGSDGHTFVRFHGSKNWMELSAGEGGGGSNIPPTWTARVGAFADDPRGGNPIGGENVLVRWVDDQQVQRLITEGAATVLVDKTPKNAPIVDVDELVRNLKQRNYEEVARKIAGAPEDLQAIAQLHRDTEFAIIQELRKTHPTHALQRLDDLIDIYGKQPDWLMLKSLIEMGERSRLAAKRVDQAGAKLSTEQSTADFLTEINGILSSGRGGSHFKAVRTSNGAIYIQDSPGFSTTDPNLSVDEVLPFGTEARVYQFESGSIGASHVSSAGYDDPVTAFLLTGDNGTSNLASIDLSNYPNFSVNSAGSEDEECEEEAKQAGTGQDQCPRKVYVVVGNVDA